jgi:UDP-N-acetyl-2-amino-2-deoxyglucuronate dehydrogenase
LHDSHIRFALKSGAHAICEKPLVLNPHNIDQLKIIEEETGKKVYTILQLRLHDSIVALKNKIAAEIEADPTKIYDLDLTYLTSRGKWYFVSWKGDEAKSGGIASNIGVHFFDMLSWIFGPIEENIVHIKQADTNAGYMKLKNARVRWFLSVNYEYIPDDVKANGKTTYRSITVNGDEFEFSEGFTDLHTTSYKHILEGGGFGLDEARNSIEIVSAIRKLSPIGLNGNYHPFCEKI